MADKNEIMISMDPAMLAKFQSSTHVSSKSHFFVDPNSCVSECSRQGHFCQYDEGLIEASQDPGPNQG